MCSDLLAGKERNPIIRNTCAGLGDEVLQHRGDDETGGSQSGESGVENSLLGAANDGEITAGKASGLDSAIVIPVHI